MSKSTKKSFFKLILHRMATKRKEKKKVINVYAFSSIHKKNFSGNPRSFSFASVQKMQHFVFPPPPLPDAAEAADLPFLIFRFLSFSFDF